MIMRIATVSALMATLVATPATAGVSIPATGIGECNRLAQLYRINPDTVVPADCANRGAFKRLLPPPDDAPPPPDASGPPAP
jgi:hypothetical protein